MSPIQVAVLVFQCLSGDAPTYLSDDCQLIADISMCQRRSTDTAMSGVRRSHNTAGDRCFATAVPHLWNSLPSKIRQCDSLEEFKQLLKTHLFGDHGTL